MLLIFNRSLLSDGSDQNSQGTPQESPMNTCAGSVRRKSYKNKSVERAPESQLSTDNCHDVTSEHLKTNTNNLVDVVTNDDSMMQQ